MNIYHLFYYVYLQKMRYLILHSFNSFVSSLVQIWAQRRSVLLHTFKFQKKWFSAFSEKLVLLFILHIFHI